MPLLILEKVSILSKKMKSNPQNRPRQIFNLDQKKLTYFCEYIEN